MVYWLYPDDILVLAPHIWKVSMIPPTSDPLDTLRRLCADGKWIAALDAFWSLLSHCAFRQLAWNKFVRSEIDLLHCACTTAVKPVCETRGYTVTLDSLLSREGNGLDRARPLLLARQRSAVLASPCHEAQGSEAGHH